MKQMKALALCLLIGIAFLAGLGFRTPFAAAQTATMRVDPSSVSANVGDTVTISVVIVDVQQMFGYEFRLFWNTSLLESTLWNYTTKKWIDPQVTPSTPPAQWRTDFYAGRNDITVLTDGMSQYFLSLSAIPPSSPVSGSFSLVTLTFKVIGEGSTLLDLANTVVGDQYANPILHNVVDGFFTTIRRDVAITKVQPKSLSVTQNSTIRIDVEATNFGEVAENFTVATYANDTNIGEIKVVGIQAVVNMAPSTSQNLPFLWNTMNATLGIYQIFANATMVERDVNSTNNQLVDGTIEVTGLSQAARDVAVVGMTANSTLFAQGETAMITVAVENKGSIDERNLNLTVYYNNTFLEVVLFPDIHSGDELEYSFNWSTEDRLGDYVFRANVTIPANETDVTNNEMTMTIVVTKVPVADFTFSPAEPVKNTEVTFDASVSHDPDGSIVNYTWNFGESYIVDNSNVSTYIGHGMIVKYTYTHVGTFKVTLTVTDNRGLNYTVSRALTYTSRTEKNVTVVDISVVSISPEILYAITAVIVIVVLATVYVVLLRKPKVKSQDKRSKSV
jgi:hypothetical protein